MRFIVFSIIILTAFVSLAEDQTPLKVDTHDQYWAFDRTVPPEYPRKALKEGLTGYVRVLHTIDKKGRVKDIQVLKSVPSDIFVRPTIKALKKFRYKPTESNPDRTPIRTEFVMRFELDQS
ncbi:MAG: energy transducer TonB [Pseudomonadota bacterium]